MAENSGNSLSAGSCVNPKTFASIRRQALLNGYKWDPQVGDNGTLESFPLILRSSVWKVLAHQAECLALEAAEAEGEISRRPALLKQLGLPVSLSKVLGKEIPMTPAAGRIIRFDFHLTTEGWRISEANSDVPGGFTEASCFTELMAGCLPHLRISGDPAGDWTRCLAKAAGPSGVVGLLSAPSYAEDNQVVAYLASCLRKCGCNTHLAKPEQVVWRDGVAFLETAWHKGPLNAIVRFYQAEWLCQLPRKMGWEYFFRGGKTPVANPALAIISESKRFPVVWDELASKLPTWRALLPETSDPREISWNRDDGWLLKTAMCNTGDTVSKRDWMKPGDWRKTQWKVLLSPYKWVAQRQFESVPIATPVGLRHACIGIYTVNGKAAGAYARLSKTPVINYLATDVALLLETDD
jgi:glutathionylspermidine synthase